MRTPSGAAARRLAGAVTACGLAAAAWALPAAASAAATTAHSHPALWVSASAPVTSGNGTSCAAPGYATIQAAVNAAPSGATVRICAGTYQEQVQITAPVTLTGTGGVVTIELPAVPAAATVCAATLTDQYGVDVCGSVSVTMQGLTIDSAWPAGTCNDGLDAVFVGNGGTLHFDDSAVTAAGASPINGCQGGVGIEVKPGHLGVSDSDISGYQKNGITVSGTGSTATISGATVTGAGPTPVIAQNGIEIASGARASITDTRVSGNECDAPSCGADSLADSQSAGLLFFNAASGSRISQSTLSGNDIGGYFAGGPGKHPAATMSHDRFTDNRYEDVVLDQGSAEVTDCTISGGNVGIQLPQYQGQTASIWSFASHDVIEDASVAPVQVYSDQAAGDLPGSFRISDSRIRGPVLNNSPAAARVKIEIEH